MKLNGKYRPNQRILWSHNFFFRLVVVVVVNLIHFQSKFYEYDSGFFPSLVRLCGFGFVWKIGLPHFRI